VCNGVCATREQFAIWFQRCACKGQQSPLCCGGVWLCRLFALVLLLQLQWIVSHWSSTFPVRLSFLWSACFAWLCLLSTLFHSVSAALCTLLFCSRAFLSFSFPVLLDCTSLPRRCNARISFSMLPIATECYWHFSLPLADPMPQSGWTKVMVIVE